MNGGDNSVNRRQHERFKLKVRAYVSFNADQTKLGQVADISQGGLAFLSIEEFKSAAGDIVLFSQGGDFWLDRIPVMVKGCCKIDSRPFFSLTTLRRYSLQFGNLSEEQTGRLDSFIQEFAVH